LMWLWFPEMKEESQSRLSHMPAVQQAPVNVAGAGACRTMANSGTANDAASLMTADNIGQHGSLAVAWPSGAAASSGCSVAMTGVPPPQTEFSSGLQSTGVLATDSSQSPQFHSPQNASFSSLPHTAELQMPFAGYPEGPAPFQLSVQNPANPAANSLVCYCCSVVELCCNSMFTKQLQRFMDISPGRPKNVWTLVHAVITFMYGFLGCKNRLVPFPGQMS